MTSDLVAAAVRDSVAVAAAHGVVCDDPLVLKETANVVVHLRPAPLIAKVSASTRDVRPDVARWLARELEMAQHVARAGLPTVQPSDLVPASVHAGPGGSVMSLWAHLPHDATTPIGPAVVGEMLGQLHEVLATMPLATPPLHTPLADIRRYVDRARPAGVDPADMARIGAAYERVIANPALHAGPVQTLHGDSHPGNLLLGPAGWVWCDYEDTCAGPVTWDLAALAGSSRIDGRAALAAYPLPYDEAGLAAAAELRTLHVTVWSMLFAERLPERRAYAAERLALVDRIAR